MHCLYCDRPLALLQRLTGDGDFCSKEHRKIYQLEQNQLALERLLETQPASKNRAKRERPVAVARPPVEVAPPPVEVIEVEVKEERRPDTADFVPSYPQEASAVSGVLRLTGDPRFVEIVPEWRESLSDPGSEGGNGPGTYPKVAVFQAESLDPRAFGAVVRFPGVFDFSSTAGAQLTKSMPPYDISVTIARQPGGAGFVADQPLGPLASAAPHPESEPIFNVKSIARMWSADAGVIARRNTKLRADKFLSAIEDAPSIPGRTRGGASEPRWKSLQQILPGQPTARIVLVFGSFLRRPVHPAVGQDGLPESFEIRLQPISFPPFAPRMASLEERLHRTDRIGFSPP